MSRQEGLNLVMGNTHRAKSYSISKGIIMTSLFILIEKNLRKSADCVCVIVLYWPGPTSPDHLEVEVCLNACINWVW